MLPCRLPQRPQLPAMAATAPSIFDRERVETASVEKTGTVWNVHVMPKQGANLHERKFALQGMTKRQLCIVDESVTSKMRCVSGTRPCWPSMSSAMYQPLS